MGRGGILLVLFSTWITSATCLADSKCEGIFTDVKVADSLGPKTNSLLIKVDGKLGGQPADMSLEGLVEQIRKNPDFRKEDPVILFGNDVGAYAEVKEVVNRGRLTDAQVGHVETPVPWSADLDGSTDSKTGKPISKKREGSTLALYGGGTAVIRKVSPLAAKLAEALGTDVIAPLGNPRYYRRDGRLYLGVVREGTMLHRMLGRGEAFARFKPDGTWVYVDPSLVSRVEFTARP